MVPAYVKQSPAPPAAGCTDSTSVTLFFAALWDNDFLKIPPASFPQPRLYPSTQTSCQPFSPVFGKRHTVDPLPCLLAVTGKVAAMHCIFGRKRKCQRMCRFKPPFFSSCPDAVPDAAPLSLLKPACPLVQDKAGRRTIKRFHQTASSGFLVQILSMQQNPWAQFLSGFHTGCAPGIPPALPLFFKHRQKMSFSMQLMGPETNGLFHSVRDGLGSRPVRSARLHTVITVRLFYGKFRMPQKESCNTAFILLQRKRTGRIYQPAAFFSALRQLRPARCPAALHTAPRFRDSIRCRLPRAFGTSPHRSRGRPPKILSKYSGK